MDAAQLGDTFWTLLGILMGVFLTGIFQFLTVNLKIRADRKRFREDRWWNAKFDLFREIEKSLTDVVSAATRSDKKYILNFRRELRGILLRCLALFENIELKDEISAIVKLTGKPNKEVVSEKSMKAIGSAYMDALIICKKELEIG